MYVNNIVFIIYAWYSYLIAYTCSTRKSRDTRHCNLNGTQYISRKNKMENKHMHASKLYVHIYNQLLKTNYSSICKF